MPNSVTSYFFRVWQETTLSPWKRKRCQINKICLSMLLPFRRTPPWMLTNEMTPLYRSYLTQSKDVIPIGKAFLELTKSRTAKPLEEHCCNLLAGGFASLLLSRHSPLLSPLWPKYKGYRLKGHEHFRGAEKSKGNLDPSQKWSALARLFDQAVQKVGRSKFAMISIRRSFG
jgi:hypothetical protein